MLTHHKHRALGERPGSATWDSLVMILSHCDSLGGWRVVV